MQARCPEILEALVCMVLNRGEVDGRLQFLLLMFHDGIQFD